MSPDRGAAAEGMGVLALTPSTAPQPLRPQGRGHQERKPTSLSIPACTQGAPGAHQPALGSSSSPCPWPPPVCSGLAQAPRHRHGTVGCRRQHCSTRGASPASQLLWEDPGCCADSRHEAKGAGTSCLRKPPKSQVSIFIYFGFFPLSLCLKAICSMCGGPTASRRSRSAPERTQGGGTGFFFLCEVLFASTITQTVTSFTRKHWRVPKGWQQPSSARAKGRRLSLPLLLHHTCPSASSSSAPGVFGPFSHAAFSAAFSTPVLLAASCKTADKAHGAGTRRR